LSRLCEIGVAAMRNELQRLVPEGAGWQACEVDNLRHDPGRWPAALVRPGALVQAWLDEAERKGALTTLWNARVHKVSKHDLPCGASCWRAFDERDQRLAEAPFVVVSGAWGSHALMTASSALVPDHAWPLRPVKGQMSLGELGGPPLAARPQRQNGVFVPQYEDTGLPPAWPQRIWAMGSTYDRGDHTHHTTPEAHARNAESLSAMLPLAALSMQASEASGTLLGWAQVRCASLDRLPLAGAVPDMVAMRSLMTGAGSKRSRLQLQDMPRMGGLFTLCALGSRGLSLALPMAQLLAGQMMGEPVELESDLKDSVDPARFAWRHARRQAQAATA
jgi:tRNA 5-methylaminomethyl-2-thiouridine biosynthesis bifunctional protein